MCIYIYIYIHTFIYVYTCKYIHIHKFIYTHTRTCTLHAGRLTAAAGSIVSRTSKTMGKSAPAAVYPRCPGFQT